MTTQLSVAEKLARDSYTTDEEFSHITIDQELARRTGTGKLLVAVCPAHVYAEEADLCFRMWKAGWPCVFMPTAQIIHRDGGGKCTVADCAESLNRSCLTQSTAEGYFARGSRVYTRHCLRRCERILSFGW